MLRPISRQRSHQDQQNIEQVNSIQARVPLFNEEWKLSGARLVFVRPSSGLGGTRDLCASDPRTPSVLFESEIPPQTSVKSNVRFDSSELLLAFLEGFILPLRKIFFIYQNINTILSWSTSHCGHFCVANLPGCRGAFIP